MDLKSELQDMVMSLQVMSYLLKFGLRVIVSGELRVVEQVDGGFWAMIVLMILQQEVVLVIYGVIHGR